MTILKKIIIAVNIITIFISANSNGQRYEQKKQRDGKCISIETINIEASDKKANIQTNTHQQAIILIPGLMSDDSVWENITKPLSKHYQIHKVNISGFAGKVPCSENENILPQVKLELENYIHQQQLIKPILMGHSLGAFLSYWLAIDNPNTFSSLLAVDGLPFLSPIFTHNANTTAQDMALQASNIKTMYAQSTAEQRKNMTMPSLYIQARSDKNQQKILSMVMKSDGTTIGSAIATMLTTDLRKNARQITIPVLLLAAQGALPNKAMKQSATLLYQQQIDNIEKAKLVINKQARHFIMFDEPQWFEQQVMQFLLNPTSKVKK